MPEQSDYGNKADPDIQLVPDTLRVYRHFLLEKGELRPMAASIDRGNPYAVDRRDRSPDLFREYGCSCPFCAGSQPEMYGNSWPPRVQVSDGEPFVADCRADTSKGDHETPSQDCKCGFYAHYSPEEDFYPTTHWRYQPDDAPRETRNIPRWKTDLSVGIDLHPTANPYSTGYVQYEAPRQQTIIVRAVVEVSGKVILGTRGVRAEKMRLIALSPDWGKYDSFYDRRNWMGKDRYISYQDDWDVWGSNHPSAEVEYSVAESTAMVAAAHRAEFYDGYALMYRAYPQPDIDHLKPKETDEQPAGPGTRPDVGRAG